MNAPVLKRCPKCGKSMIKRHRNSVYLTDPPQRPWYWWCGGCGHEEEGGVDSSMSQEELWHRIWEAAQDEHDTR